jgi:exodeoxyribonuclease VIII
MTTQHFMLDIETLGQLPNAPVVSVAVVAFKPGKETQWEMLWILDPEDQRERKADFDTIRWWMTQKPEAAAHWVHPQERLPTLTALKELKWMASSSSGLSWEQAIWWGNSPNFDETIMTGLYREFSIAPPWKFREWRDIRTIREFLKDKTFPRNPNLHNPLADCKAQIEVVERFYKEQGLI